MENCTNCTNCTALPSHFFLYNRKLQHTRHLSFSLGPIDCWHSRHIDFDLTSNPPAANERMFLMPMTLDGDYPRYNINIIISIAVSMTCEVNPRWYFQRTLKDQPSKGKLAPFSFSLSSVNSFNYTHVRTFRQLYKHTKSKLSIWW